MPDSIVILGVSQGEVVSGGRVITAQVVADPVRPITRVDFLLDGSLFVSDVAPPYSLGGQDAQGVALPFDTNTLSNGTHTLQAIATIQDVQEPPAIGAWPEPTALPGDAVVRVLGQWSGSSALDLNEGASAPATVFLSMAGFSKYCWNGGRLSGVPTGYENPGDSNPFLPFLRDKTRLPGGAAQDKTTAWMSWRWLQPGHHPGDIIVPGNSLEVAIEYKDNLFAPNLPSTDPRRPKAASGVLIEATPQSADSLSTAGNLVVSHLPALRDHRWKRHIFQIPAGAPKQADGTIRLRIGGLQFGNNWIYGSALIHRIIATTSSSIPPRPSVQGFWPAVQEIWNGQEIPNVISTPSAAEQAQINSFQTATGCKGHWSFNGGVVETRQRLNPITDRAGTPIAFIATSIPQYLSNLSQVTAIDHCRPTMNFCVLHDQGNGRRNWGRAAFVSGNTKSIPAGEMAVLMDAKTPKIGTSPWCYTDTTDFWVRNSPTGATWGNQSLDGIPLGSFYNGTWFGILNVWKDAIRIYGNDPRFWLWYIKDEWDHEDVNWASGGTTPEELNRQLRALSNQEAPGLPTLVTSMGWRNSMIKMAFDHADIQVVDRYPSPANLAECANMAEEMRRHSRGKPFGTVLSFTSSDNPAGAQVWMHPNLWRQVDYVMKGWYMGLVHGASAFWMFGESASMDGGGTGADPGTTVQDSINYYSSFGTFFDELRSFEDFINLDAEEIARTRAAAQIDTVHGGWSYGSSGGMSVSAASTAVRDQVSASLRKGRSGKYYLLLVNEHPTTSVTGLTVLFSPQVFDTHFPGSGYDTFIMYDDATPRATPKNTFHVFTAHDGTLALPALGPHRRLMLELRPCP